MTMTTTAQKIITVHSVQKAQQRIDKSSALKAKPSLYLLTLNNLAGYENEATIPVHEPFSMTAGALAWRG